MHRLSGFQGLQAGKRSSDLPENDVAERLAVDAEGWKKEAQDIAGYYAKFGKRLPAALPPQLQRLNSRLGLAQ